MTDDNTSPTKALILPWSGGMDSTALLLQHLIAAKVDHIYTMYINVSGNGTKAKCEHSAIDKHIVSITESDIWTDQSKMKWTHDVYQIKDYPDVSVERGLIQPYWWMMYAAMLSQVAVSAYDEVSVHIGYVRGDTALTYRNEIWNMWNGLSAVINIDTPVPPLLFPFSGMTKSHILKRLEKYEGQYNRPFVDSCWVCEEPVTLHTPTIHGVSRCGKCRPCQRDPRFST